jgi:hypothetical protein
MIREMFGPQVFVSSPLPHGMASRIGGSQFYVDRVIVGPPGVEPATRGMILRGGGSALQWRRRYVSLGYIKLQLKGFHRCLAPSPRPSCRPAWLM